MGIRLENITLDNSLKFMEVNVRSSPSPSDLALVCVGQEPALIGGLLAFRALLKRVYTAGQYLEGKDDDARFNGLREAMLLLYTCVTFGKLASCEGQQAIVVDKEVLRSEYKKGRLSDKIKLLSHRGLVVEWLATSGDRVSQSKAALLSVTYSGDERLIPAIKYLATRIAAIEPIEPRESDRKGRPFIRFSFDSISDKLQIFSKADFETAFMQTALRRDALDPLREDVTATMGKYGQAWMHLVDKLVNQYALECFGTFYFGQWGVSFHQKRSRPFLIFTIAYERLGIELTVPVDSAEQIIRQRNMYSRSIREGIAFFHCVQCPKECKGRNLIQIDGVTLCTGRAEARRIYTELATVEDWNSIEAIADAAFA